MSLLMRATGRKQGSVVTPHRLSEKQMIGQLEAGREYLLSAPGSRRLLSLLRQRLQSITRNVYVVRYIPEQTEELYDILVDGVNIVHIELPRDPSSTAIVFEKSELEEYRRHLTKVVRRKLELAIELAQR
ncbi:hypothetical protein [Bradyrhizobium ganzhouense]|uniref:hypothetical protein n=1 Tax=Bradyrhizobium ganzhouense TaxID=1179767 RepID=UPI003CF1A7ED